MDCKDFTAEKVEKNHLNCKYNKQQAYKEPCKLCMNGSVDKNGIHTSYWQPIPKTISPEESKGKGCEKCRNYIKFIGEDTLIKAVNCVKYKSKRKEKKMWNKLRKRSRRITMAWDLFGIFLLCKLVNPWVFKFWHWLLPGTAESCYDESKCFHIYAAPWLLTIAMVAAILGSLYALDRLAAWWYGEK